MDELFEKYVDKITKGGTLQVNRLDLHEQTFKAGYKAAMEEFKKCKDCGKPNKLHPSMLDCHSCRVKQY